MSIESEALPIYAFVPGGPWPHPIRDPGGHSFQAHREAPLRLEEGRWENSAPYRRGFELFNAGYYWEAHEVWESLWMVHGRHGRFADLLKGLIKLAAAGVKVRQGQAHGVVTHSLRALSLFEKVRLECGQECLGLKLGELVERADAISRNPPISTASRNIAVAKVFEFRIEPASAKNPGSGDDRSRTPDPER